MSTTHIEAVVMGHKVLHLKRLLTSKKFDSDIKLKESIEKSLTSQAAHFYEQGIQNLVPRYDSLSVGGAYVEK
jgi:hypothetical protein